jgi:hypothetical protein
LSCGKIDLTFLAKDHAAFDIDLVKFAGWADIGQTSGAYSVKGGNTENGDCMGNPAEKWFAYSTLGSRVQGGFSNSHGRDGVYCLR